MLKSNKAINQVVYFVLLSVSLSLGYFLRNNLIVVMVAILLTIAITGKYSIRHKMIYFSIFALSFVAIAGLFSVAQRTDKVVSQPNSVTPALRYVYMGLNPATQGEINGDDAWRFETQGYSKAQKNIMYRTAISQRLKQYSLPGLSRHLINKVDFMFASGSFDQDLGLLANRDGSISWFAENSFIWTNAFHGFYVLIFILLGLGCITQIRRKQDDPLMLFSVLSIVGVFSFQVLFWEVRDRYMLPMIPFVLLMSTFSLNRFCESDSVHILSGNLNSRNRKYLVPVIFFTGVISILSLMRNLNLADNQNRYMDFVKIQPFQRYAMNDDFNIKPGIGYKFPIHLTKKANLFQLPYRSYSQGFTIQLINNHSGKRYIFKNNQSEIADTFRPGMYSLVIKNNSTKPITTRMIVDTGSARLTSYSSTLSHDSLVPAYEFDAVHNRPIVSQLGIFLLIFIPYVFGCLLVICVWRKNRIANG
ncbi:hypothetical protein OAL24_00432 [Oenococcus sicerae]|nr:hypothetical protein OAL24_00432 [Oenococcus sicerae]